MKTAAAGTVYQTDVLVLLGEMKCVTLLAQTHNFVLTQNMLSIVSTCRSPRVQESSIQAQEMIFAHAPNSAGRVGALRVGERWVLHV